MAFGEHWLVTRSDSVVFTEEVLSEHWGGPVVALMPRLGHTVPDQVQSLFVHLLLNNPHKQFSACTFADVADRECISPRIDCSAIDRVVWSRQWRLATAKHFQGHGMLLNPTGTIMLCHLPT